MNEGRISTRYARALLLTIETDGAGETLYHQTMEVLPILVSVRGEIARVFSNALVSQKAKETFIEDFFNRFAPLLASFGRLMVSRGRGLYLERALRVFLHLYRESRGIVHADVLTAVDLQEEQDGAIRAFLARLYGREVELSSRVDPDLIGGFQLEVDGRLLDRSVRGELEQIASRLNS